MGLFSKEAPTPQPVRRGGAELKCDHCGHDQFVQGRVQMLMQGGDLAGLIADCYACEKCDRLHWFRHRRDQSSD